MSRVVVVGSGASGVHFALTALAKGHDVLMLDVGREKPAVVGRDSSFDQLKSELADPAEYFLGARYEAVTLPGPKGEIYEFPPSKRYVFAGVPAYKTRSTGIDPLASFARGGLAEAWTAGVYPFNQHELAAFPVTYDDFAHYYGVVAERIGVNGAADDLARFFPVHDHLLEPLELDHHSRTLMARYERRRSQLNQRLGCHIGRSRIATLTRTRNGRQGCSYCGRCLWGCPTGAFYTPSISLEECLRHPRFSYRPGLYVSHFNCDDQRRITQIVAASTENGETVEIPVETLVLAAGTLSTSRIFLESIYRATGQVVRLPGLMDNRQILVPYLNLSLMGAAYASSSYQYHQLAMGLEGAEPAEYVHGQITTLTTGLVHPIIENLPLNLGTAIPVFRQVRAALGVVNINLHDTRRADSVVTIESGNGGGQSSRLVVHYTSPPGEAERIKRVIAQVRRVLWKLNCIVPPGMVHLRPMGSSVHYSGTLPMSRTPAPHTVSPNCRSHDFTNLILADGSSFPFLPAKNLTFTLMANATRVADQAL